MFKAGIGFEYCFRSRVIPTYPGLAFNQPFQPDPRNGPRQKSAGNDCWKPRLTLRGLPRYFRTERFTIESFSWRHYRRGITADLFGFAPPKYPNYPKRARLNYSPDYSDCNTLTLLGSGGRWSIPTRSPLIFSDPDQIPCAVTVWLRF